MLSNRNLIIPKVVKAIRNMDTTKPDATCRSQINEASVTSNRSKSSDTRRLSITMKKRLIPMDILTDAKINMSSELQLTDRSARQHNAQSKRTPRHQMIAGEGNNREMQELLRMASQSASRERRVISQANSFNDEQPTPQSPAKKTVKKLESSSDKKVFRTQGKPFTKWNSNTDVF